MAVVSVTEIHQGRGGDIQEKAVRTYRRVFHVLTDSELDGPATVRLAVGIPRPWDSYVTDAELDITAFCKRVGAEPHGETPFLWIVTAEYSSATDTRPEDQEENPLLRPAEWQWGFASVSKVITTDKDGGSVTNSAREPFDPPLELPTGRVTLTITRNEAGFDVARANRFNQSVNSVVWYGQPVRTALMNAVSAVTQTENGIPYVRVTYEIHFDPETFDLSVLDSGYRDINGKLFRDPVDGSPMGSPTLLNGNGEKLGTGADPVYLTWRVRDEQDFNELGF
jgi:hypothetical protein